MAGKQPASRSSVSSLRGSPSEENAPAVPPTASYSRGSSISGAPPPIPERSTPGPGSFCMTIKPNSMYLFDIFQDRLVVMAV